MVGETAEGAGRGLDFDSIDVFSSMENAKDGQQFSAFSAVKNDMMSVNLHPDILSNIIPPPADIRIISQLAARGRQSPQIRLDLPLAP
jgi:hypothetical protein